MAGLPAGTIPVEYTRGTSAFFPSNSSMSISTTQADNSATVTASTGVGVAFPANPVIGQTFYRTDTAGLYVWTGAAWQLT